MSIEQWTEPPQHWGWHIKREQLPDGTWKAWIAEAPTSFAFGETEAQAMAKVTLLFIQETPDQKENDR